jgi:hypothetical protein
MEGVALGAIQGLHRRLRDKEAEIEALRRRVEELSALEARLRRLEKAIGSGSQP